LYQVDLLSGDVDDKHEHAAGQRHRLLFRVERDYRDDTEIDFSCLDVGRSPAR
jgi:hypothetical protein